jgi:protein-tyrosine phosphatase
MPSGFVDIHSHVLYGLDDGAKTRDESVEMLRVAAEAGTTDIVATPHANSRYKFRPDVIAARIAELQPLTDVRIHRGCDFHLQVDNIQDALAHPQKYTIDGGIYLLVEFSDVIFAGADEILYQLLAADMIPIVTHPERNGTLQRKQDDLARWIELGCYVQVTAGSILGRFGRAARSSAFEMLDRGLVQFVATDTHDPEHRSPRLDEAFKVVTERYGEGQSTALFMDNPRTALTGGTLDLDPPAAMPKKRKWYQVW